MSEKLKYCPFCRGEAFVHILGNEIAKGYYIACDECGAKTKVFGYEAEVIEAWNRRTDVAKNATTPEVRTAKVIEHDASITDTDGYKYQRSEYLCGACRGKVLGGDEYCSHCGTKLDWGE